MVPRSFRKRFPSGCFGFHASLLLELRGGAPLNWAILSGLSETGVTLFSLEDGVDDGLVFGQARFPIGSRTTIGDLVNASREACSALTRKLLRDLLAGTATSSIQKGIPSYGLQRIPEDGRIEWNRSAVDIDRLVRAVSRPYPGAFTSLNGERIRIWATEMTPENPLVFGAPGQIANLPGASPGLSLPCVVTGAGILFITDATDSRDVSVLETLRKSSHRRFQ
jgi:methionyl-tRNA formyltransferase